MVDLNQYASVAGLAALIAIIIRFAYPDPWRKEGKPFMALGLGIALALAVGYVTVGLPTPADWLSWGIGGFMAGVTATGGYEATKKLLPA